MHQVEAVKGDSDYYKVKIIEYANLKKQLKEKDQALKSAEEGRDHLLAE